MLLKPRYPKLQTGLAATKGLVGAWPFFAGAGNTLRDLSGNGNHGTLTNGPAWVAGRAGAALSFDGTNDYVTFGSGMNYPAVSYSVWVYARSFSNAYNTVIGRHTGAAYSLLYIKSNGKLAPFVAASGNLVYDGTGSNTLSVNTWYHLAITYSSVTGLLGYVNGLVDGSFTANGAINTSAAETRIGKDENGNFFNGIIDGAKVYSRAISQHEIKQIFQDEYRIYRQPRRRNFFVVVSGGAISGVLSATEADDTLVSSGVLPIIGTLSITEANDTSAGTGVLPIKGLSSVVEADDTASGAGVLPIAASLSLIEAGDTVSSAGSLPIVGTLVITDADDTASGAGTLPIRGLVSVTEANDTTIATGILPINGLASIVEGDDTAGGAGVLPIVGSLSIIEAGDTLFATSSATNTISGVLSITEDSDTATGASVLPIAGVLSIVEADDVLSSVGVLPIRALASLIEANDTSGGAGSTAIIGSLSIVEANDILTSVNFVGVQPQFIRVKQESLLASKITFDSLFAAKVVGESIER